MALSQPSIYSKACSVGLRPPGKEALSSWMVVRRTQRNSVRCFAPAYELASCITVDECKAGRHFSRCASADHIMEERIKNVYSNLSGAPDSASILVTVRILAHCSVESTALIFTAKI